MLGYSNSYQKPFFRGLLNHGEKHGKKTQANQKAFADTCFV